MRTNRWLIMCKCPKMLTIGMDQHHRYNFSQKLCNCVFLHTNGKLVLFSSFSSSLPIIVLEGVIAPPHQHQHHHHLFSFPPSPTYSPSFFGREGGGGRSVQTWNRRQSLLLLCVYIYFTVRTSFPRHFASRFTSPLTLIIMADCLLLHSLLKSIGWVIICSPSWLGFSFCVQHHLLFFYSLIFVLSDYVRLLFIILLDL
jgi:hypothetical protein